DLGSDCQEGKRRRRQSGLLQPAHQGVADLYYKPQSGRPILVGARADLSTDVQTRSKAGCRDAVETRPTTKAITKFSKGDAICAKRFGYVALLVVTFAP